MCDWGNDDVDDFDDVSHADVDAAFVDWGVDGMDTADASPRIQANPACDWALSGSDHSDQDDVTDAAGIVPCPSNIRVPLASDIEESGTATVARIEASVSDRYL